MKDFSIKSLIESLPSLIESLPYIILLIGFIFIFLSGYKVWGEGGLVGYSLVTGAIGLIYVLFIFKETAETGETTRITGFFNYIAKVTKNGWPLILLFLIMGWVVYLNARYNNYIKEGNTTAQYKTFSNINLILLFIQLYLIYRYKQDENKVTQGNTGDSLTAKLLKTFLDNVPYFILFIALIQITVVGIMDINLSYFTTDG